jgi:hypothetical protein
MPPQATGVAEPGRRQDPAPRFDVAHQGIVNYCPQPLVGVNNTLLSSYEPFF